MRVTRSLLLRSEIGGHNLRIRVHDLLEVAKPLHRGQQIEQLWTIRCHQSHCCWEIAASDRVDCLYQRGALACKNQSIAVDWHKPPSFERSVAFVEKSLAVRTLEESLHKEDEFCSVLKPFAAVHWDYPLLFSGADVNEICQRACKDATQGDTSTYFKFFQIYCQIG
jgi:hypothetical protein